MDNTVIVTDDELSLIMTSLTMTIASTDAYIKKEGESALDLPTKETVDGMRILLKSLIKDYF